MDRIDAQRRSANMSRIRSTDTTVELILRRALWLAGLRGYRVHSKSIPGRPDVAYTRLKVAVFVDGCFWHGCPECYVPPSSNTEYWTEKIQRNRRRDTEVTQELTEAGWAVIRIWEHEVRNDPGAAMLRVQSALTSRSPGRGSPARL
jgi:DNA mismatch endonuclease (patch repair protein)